MGAVFSVDAREVSALTGFLSQVSMKVNTPQYMGPVLKYVHSKMSEAFTEYMSTVAGAAPERFHHVYEWGQIGDPNGQLWTDSLRGYGNTRLATFEWRASKKTVPVRDDFKEVDVKQIHIFTWKAPVMEYSTDITILPQRGKGLAYFSGPTTPTDKYEIKFTTKPLNIQYPGGRQVKGAFTKEYVSWWAGAGASTLFETRIKRLLEQDLADMPLQTVTGQFRTGVRSSTKTGTIMTMSDSDVAYDVGKSMADAWMARNVRRYIDGARARDAIIGGLSG